MATMPIAIMRVESGPGPRTVTMAIARSRAGKASRTSMNRMRTLSVQPAEVAGRRAPINEPMKIAKPTVSEADRAATPRAVDDRG